MTSSFTNQHHTKTFCVFISYKDLLNIQKGTKIIENLVLQAEDQNFSSVSITLTDKARISRPKNASQLTFVKNGVVSIKKHSDFLNKVVISNLSRIDNSNHSCPSVFFIHPIYGQGAVYLSVKDALIANNFDRTRHFRNKEYPIYNIKLKDLNEYELSILNLPKNVNTNFPKSILHGSLLADGALKFRKTNQNFTINQTANPKNKHIEHISYLLYLFSKIPADCLPEKPLWLYKKPMQFSSKKKESPTEHTIWSLILNTRTLSLFNSYAKEFYPNAENTKSGIKVIPSVNYLKTIIKDYETVAHMICQDGAVTSYEVRLSICPYSYKGSARIAITLYEALKIPCFIKEERNANNKTAPYRYFIVIVRTGMEAIFENTREIFTFMPYKMPNLHEPRKASVYKDNLKKCEDFYSNNKNEAWLETNQM